MLTLFFRCIVLYLLVLFMFRLMGKRQLGELQPFEFVITLIVADLATIPMAEINVPLAHGVIPLITLMLLHFLISLLSRKSIFLRKVLNGKPVIIITPDGIDYKSLKKLNMNFNDLNEALRELNYFSYDQIAYAIVETNGKITVLPNADNSPLTAEDLKLQKKEPTIPLMLVCDGKIMKDNLEISGLNEEFILEQAKKFKTKKIKDITVATIDNDGKMYLQIKNMPYKSFNTSFKGGDW